MPGYVIAQIEVDDPEGYEAYRAAVPETIAQYGGRYVVRGNAEPDVLEGSPPYPRMVVIEFETVAAARMWYESPEYRAIAGTRHANSHGVIAIYEAAD